MNLSRLLLSIVVVSFQSVLRSQNLVMNGGFEAYTDCPRKDGRLEAAEFWLNPATDASPDYFNRCANQYPNMQIGVPANFVGYSEPHSGDGYADIILFEGYDYFDYREYVQTKLTSPMEKGTRYRYSFFLKMADRASHFSEFISVCFSDGG